MKTSRLLLVSVLLSSFLFALPASAEEPGRYGSLWVGPRVGVGMGFAGPRASYLVGLELSYRTPYYFYYNLELGFLHMLPRTVTVPETAQTEMDGSSTVLVPEHEAKATGLYGIPFTMEIGLRFEVNRARLRIGVGFGAIVSIQTLEAFETSETEVIASFCFRPGFGVDVVSRDGDALLRFDLMYLWQDAEFESTGNDRDVDSLFLSFGYSWQVAG